MAHLEHALGGLDVFEAVKLRDVPAASFVNGTAFVNSVAVWPVPLAESRFRPAVRLAALSRL